MPRPCKKRRICQLPSCRRFAPEGSGGVERREISMSFEEYECIRLIDLMGMTQEQCAEQMNVARTTAQAVYNSARLKLAEFIVEGKELKLEGGEYILCEGKPHCPYIGSGHCCKNNKIKENGIMTIAVTYENGKIFQHFGHSEQFKVYKIEEDKIVSSEVIDTNGSGHGALAGLLKNLGVNALICGGIGGGARQALDTAGIMVYGGASGDADKAVADLLAGRLLFNPNELCAHHEGHHHEGGCGEHGCGEHGCH